MTTPNDPSWMKATPQTQHTSGAAIANDPALRAASVQRSDVVINLLDPKYGSPKPDGSDSSAAFLAAAVDANAAGVPIYVPRGTWTINTATRLAFTANGTGLICDPGLGAVLWFTNAAGGIDFGDGTNNVYENRMVNIGLSGRSTTTTLVRCRKVYEPYFDAARLGQSAGTLLMLTDCGQLDADRLSLSDAPIGIQLTGSTSSIITARLCNLFDLTEAVRIASTAVGRLLFTDSWFESCPDIFTLNNPGAGISIGVLCVENSRIQQTGTTQRLLSAVASTGINSQRVEFSRCYVNATSSTTPLVDFTALNNSSATFKMSMTRCDVFNACTGTMIQVNASQPWNLFQVDLERINGVTSDKWTPPKGTGGTWARPFQLFGEGAPETVVTAPGGSTYVRTDGGVGSTFYVKQTASGNTGWAAK